MLGGKMRSGAKSTVYHVRKAATRRMAPPLATATLRDADFIDPCEGSARFAIDEDRAIDERLEVVTIS